MPGRSYGRKRGFFPRGIITSIKNQVFVSTGTTGSIANVIIAKATNTPLPASAPDVSHGCIIKAIWCSFDGCGLGGTGVLNNMQFYIIKNPGNNLTDPNPLSWGTSNEKKFIFRSFKFMIMRNQDGNTPFHWEGWIKVPKRYQRMGTDDTLKCVFNNSAALTGHFSAEFIYKWYR